MQNEMNIKVLVIGYGSIGRRHVEILSGMQQVRDVEIVSKQTISGFSTHKELTEVQDLAKFDYFLIASDTHKHFSQLEYLEKSITNKTILVEKPLFDCCHEVTIKNNLVFVAYNLRLHPILQQMRNWLTSEKILSVNIITGHYLPLWRPGRDYRESYSADRRKGGGVTLDLSHEIDYVQWLFGKITKLEAVVGKISGLEINSDDIMVLIGKTDNGCFVNLSLDYISKIPMRQILVQTENLTIKADLAKNHLIRQYSTGEDEKLCFKSLDRNTTYKALHQTILSNETSDVCGFQDGLITMRIIGDIFQSSSKKKWYEF
jgi:predicted dehydrogenase